MNCIIVDDEPLAREAVELLVKESQLLNLVGTFNSATSASEYMKSHSVDLVFLDIQMPYVNGLEFARNISKSTLVIFTTAYTEYALDSYEVDAIDYLVKPIESDKFQKAVDKAITYHSLLHSEEKGSISTIEEECVFVRSERRFYKVNLTDILFIEGLKDYVIIHVEGEKIITKMNLKGIHEKLIKDTFLRINKSYIVNTEQIDSFDNNDVYIKSHAVAIGNSYRDAFFEAFVTKKL